MKLIIILTRHCRIAGNLNSQQVYPEYIQYTLGLILFPKKRILWLTLLHLELKEISQIAIAFHVRHLSWTILQTIVLEHAEPFTAHLVLAYLSSCLFYQFQSCQQTVDLCGSQSKYRVFIKYSVFFQRFLCFPLVCGRTPALQQN